MYLEISMNKDNEFERFEVNKQLSLQKKETE